MYSSVFSILKAIFDTCGFIERFSDSKKEGKKKYYNNFIEPLFSEIKTLHEYYIELFNSTLDYINDPNKDTQEIIDNLDKEIMFKATVRTSVEAQLRVLSASKKKINKIADSHLKTLLLAIFDYLTCPKTSTFLTYENFKNVFSDETRTDPFKLGIFSVLPQDLMSLSISVKNNEDIDIQIGAWPSVRHMLRKQFYKIAEQHVYDGAEYIWYSKLAKREIIESIKFMIEEVNLNYDNTTRAYYLLRNELIA